MTGRSGRPSDLSDESDGSASEPGIGSAATRRDPFSVFGLSTFLLFVLVGGVICFVTFRTVHDQAESRLRADLGAVRSFHTISWWHEQGYFASGGLISLLTPPGPDGRRDRVFYRSSSGGYMVSGYLTEKLAIAITGEYRWKVLAMHNQLLMLLTSALLGLLVFRVVMDLGVRWRDGLCYAVASQAVFLTFPIVLAQYWELSAQLAALPFAILFLLFEVEAERPPHNGKMRPFVQPLCAFLLVYLEPFYGMFFLLSYLAFVFLIRKRRPEFARLMIKTVIPATLAVLVFAVQIAWAQIRFPDMPLQGSGLMFRSGLDGSTEYYRDHIDILYGRALARRNFPFNQEQLFKWPVLFVAGALASALVIVAALRRERFRPMFTIIAAQIGAYVLYAAVFSQAVVIHPYLYDPLIATPLIMALFGFAPAIGEERWRTGGGFALLVLFAAVSCALIQMRHYAVWYPTAPPAAAESQRAGEPMRTHAYRLVT